MRSMGPYVDICGNLLACQFTSGVYNSKVRHAPDFLQVLERAKETGVEAIITASGMGVCRRIVVWVKVEIVVAIVFEHVLPLKLKVTNLNHSMRAGSEEESRSSLELVTNNAYKRFNLFSTVGIHPTRSSELGSAREADRKVILDKMKSVIDDGKAVGRVVAVGEFGLDYDRLQFCSKELQQRAFEAQFDLCEYSGLPALLHHRACGEDFYAIISRNRAKLRGSGVVHSFDGTLDEARRLMDLGLYIGINGCSLRTPANLDVACQLPLDRILLETDSPWCEIKRTHAGYNHVQTHWESKKPDKHIPGPLSTAKGRSEPCMIIQVAEIISAIMGVPIEEVATKTTQNAHRLFFPLL